MNYPTPSQGCDSTRIVSLLHGKLSNAEEEQFTRHLNGCEFCRAAIEEQVASSEAWEEAKKMLHPSKGTDLPRPNLREVTDDLTDTEVHHPQAHGIRLVLEGLKPSDDPDTLGRLGGYEITGVIGAGGMGVVLKGIDRSLDRTVAIKVLAPHLADSGAARKRFAREAKAAAAVLHVNVIAIHGVSNDEAAPYLVMPYIRGISLQKRLDLEGPLATMEILRIGSQVASGLAAAHSQGLIHRDIKPANILLEDGVERVTLTDFGLARAVDDATITHSGMIAGTPQYMSPEQARGEPMEQRSDLFSLGSVLFALSTGRPPFRAETTYGVMRRITDEEPASIRDINPEIPTWLNAIISRLMSKRAEDRYSSAAEVADLLENCLAHVQQPTQVALPESLQPQVQSVQPVRIPKVTRGWVTILLLGIVLASFLGILQFTKKKKTASSQGSDSTEMQLQTNPESSSILGSAQQAKKNSVLPYYRPNETPAVSRESKEAERLRSLLAKETKIAFQAEPLHEAIRQLLASSQVPFDLNQARIDESSQSGIRDPITLTAEGPVRELLRRILTPKGLAYIVQENCIEITSVEDAKERPSIRYYDLAFVFSSNHKAVELMNAIVQSIEPNNWTINGGKNSISLVGSMVIVVASESAHQQIDILLYNLTQVAPRNLSRR